MSHDTSDFIVLYIGSCLRTPGWFDVLSRGVNQPAFRTVNFSTLAPTITVNLSVAAVLTG